MAARLFGAVLALSLGGCALLSAPPPQASKQLLNKMPAELPQRSPNGAVLVVYPPQTRPVYDTTEMAYMTRPYEIAYFSQHEWAEPPAQMLQPGANQFGVFSGKCQRTREHCIVIAHIPLRLHDPLGGMASGALQNVGDLVNHHIRQ